ncbi:FtsH protease activity modulator HflK [Simiduia agarivorans]|uniref:Protein HflK n=1 Tax=Simiduia agarivorans (strain DSM 21679 / JCM 13881 / BCRC 17597 / SA1) TaxID=1117647 RepID=K4KM21_SIMAS|nr:FtsH protease activity modulator HflK [Simiduia agarivorans]AFV00205.1 membrane protease subunit HflK [Simiduia agarivorans SA1 = DSM 21679]
MAWNEPGGNNQDPWGGRRGGGKNDGPPDMDEALRKFQEKLGGMFGGKGGGNGAGLGAGFFGLLLVVASVLYGIAGFYQVDEQERAVVLRFGLFHEEKGAGLRWNPPLVDSVTKVNVTRVRLHPTKTTMLTEDLNIVDVNLSVQYSIRSAKDFVINVNNPENSLKEATDSALRHVIGATVMHEVLTEGRTQIAADVMARLQEYLNEYGTGIHVETVNMEDALPPKAVQAAFNDVNKAREDEERYKNEAQAYLNGVVPEARGRAQRIVEEANAYRARVIAESEGDASRFEQLLVEYKKAPRVTRDRLYLDAVESVMTSSSKVMVDVKGGNNMLYVPLDQIMRQRGNAGLSQGEISSDVIREVSDRVIDQLRREAASNRREVR